MIVRVWRVFSAHLLSNFQAHSFQNVVKLRLLFLGCTSTIIISKALITISIIFKIPNIISYLLNIIYPFKKVLYIVLKILKIATAIIKLTIHFISNSTHAIFNHLIIFCSKYNITPLITKINKPRVNIKNGNHKIFNNGLTVKLSNQRTTHHTKYNFKPHIAVTHSGINCEIAKRINQLKTTEINIFIIFSFKVK